MFKFIVPPKALALALAMGIGGFALGLTAGFWVAPVVIAAFIRHDLFALTSIPRQMWIMPVAPDWYNGTERIVWTIGALGACFVGGICGDRFLKVVWRHLVVEKYKWMTHKEVDDFLKRGGDGPVE